MQRSVAAAVSTDNSLNMNNHDETGLTQSPITTAQSPGRSEQQMLGPAGAADGIPELPDPDDCCIATHIYDTPALNAAAEPSTATHMYEFHIAYHPSYQVPVLCFKANRQGKQGLLVWQTVA